MAALAVATVTLCMYGDILLRFSDEVISHNIGDASLYFARVREFGFDELAHGNLALWNPHVFSGVPFFGGFQSALLYPLNVIYLVFPLAFALNLDICAHVFMLGFFMYLWVRARGIRPAAAFLSAGIIMFSAPYALRVLAGQLTVLSTLAYVPLLLLIIDVIFDRSARKQPLLGPCLLGIFVVSMQVLAGYPQSLFMTVVAVGLYCTLRLAFAQNRIRAALAIAAIAAAPIFVTAIQLFTSFDVGKESIRAGGGSYHFASSYSFPLENLFTLFVPGFFGDFLHHDYWGRWNFWDVSIFMGITGFILAIYGSIYGENSKKRFSGILTLCLLGIALGRYTPAYTFLYEYVPGFSSFRAPSKFLFHTMIFGAMLAGIGADTLIQKPQRASRIAIVAFALALSLGLGTAWLALTAASTTESASLWDKLVLSRGGMDEVYFLRKEIDELFIEQSARFAAICLSIATGTCVLLGTLLLLTKKVPALTYAIVGLGLLELFVFARVYRSTFYLSESQRVDIAPAYADCTEGERVLDVVRFDDRMRNYAIEVRGRNLWGYDPIVLSRYGKYMAFAGGGLWHVEELEDHVFTWTSDPIGIGLNFGYNHHTPGGMEHGQRLLQLLRTKYIVRAPVPPEYQDFVTYLKKAAGTFETEPPLSTGPVDDKPYYEISGAFPEMIFMQDYRVMPPGIDMLTEMMNPGIDLSRTVFLESEPVPAPDVSRGDITLQLLDQSTDHRTLKIDMPDAAILVFTDAYSEGWRIVPLPGSVQQEYDVLPADYTLRAVPLSAGSHHFRLEYAPRGFIIGRRISIVSTLAFCLVVVYWFTTRSRSKTSRTQTRPYARNSS